MMGVSDYWSIFEAHEGFCTKGTKAEQKIFFLIMPFKSH